MNWRKQKVNKLLGKITLGALLGLASIESQAQTLGHNVIQGQDETQRQNETKKREDAEQLAKALDYFNSQKYHECLLILQPLAEHYKLNPRYRAYLGICLYQEWEYEDAIRYLDEAIPQLEGFAPQERSIYYWTDAESYFALQRYDNAIPLYEKMLTLCHENEKADAYYRLGFCHLFVAEGGNDSIREKTKARECFEQALLGYLKYRNNSSEKARITQIKHMIQGLR